MSMRSNVLTLRTVKRGKDNALTIESNTSTSQLPRGRGLMHKSDKSQIIKEADTSNVTSSQLKQGQNTKDNEEHIVRNLDYEPVNLTATFHDHRLCNDIVVLDTTHLPGSKPGNIAELTPIEGDPSKKLLFIVRKMNDELLRRSKNSQLSISSGALLQPILGISTRSPVSVTLKDVEEVEADLIEFLVKDISLTRGDMWELSSLMKDSCVFKSQRLTFMDSIRLTVSSIYRFGKKRFSGYIGERTKIVFRSESARLVFLIQITEEMYHFQEDGEVMFHKVINSLFPSIFKRWREENTHHLITIVFAANVDFSDRSWNDLKLGERPKDTKDYYRVVVDQVNILRWSEIMVSLRYEFANFRKEIIDFQLKNGLKTKQSNLFSPTVKSDILNTIILSTTLVADRFRDPDLSRTTTHFIVISAGNGLYDVKYEDLLDTGKRLVNTELSVDIICLTQPPLHVTPLFRYIDESGKLHHCVPGWIDVSYWTESSSRKTQWTPSAKIYELQMMGIMENDMKDVIIENLNKHQSAGVDSISNYMDAYDKSVFTNNREVSIEVTTKGRGYNESSLRRFPSTPSLHWKPSKSAVTNIEPVTKITPIFSVSKTAIDSLQEIANPSSFLKLQSPKMEPIKDSSSNSSISSASFQPLRLPSIQPQESSLQRIHQSQLKSKNLLLSSSPATPPSGFSLKEKTTSIDFLRTVMWSEIENISARITNMKEFNSLTLGKWQDVFPEGVKRRSIKWRSLLSPSELPVTSPIFPSLEDFEKNFTFQTHSISLSPDNEKFMDTQGLFREIIHLRLLMGFQICWGDKVKRVENKRNSEGDSSLLVKYLDDKTRSVSGLRIYLSLDEEIHRISCDFDGSINVQRYHRASDPQTLYRDSFERIMIKTRYQHNYHPYDPNPLVVKPQIVNWNKYDQLIAGYNEDYEDDPDLKLNKVKFVLLPCEIPKSTSLLNTSNNEHKGEFLTPEELRVEGLRKLIASLHRSTFSPGADKTRRAKEEALPEINFYTSDLISFLEEQSGSSNTELSLSNTNTSTKNESLITGDISLYELAKEIQSSKGIKLTDRRWHWKVHKNCFLGLEFVTWLVDNFKDIDTREEAIKYGNKLMDQGLISHVENRHKFLDGYYFYRLEQAPLEKPIEESAAKGRSRSSSIGSKTSKFSFAPMSQSKTEDLGNSLKKVKTEASELTIGRGSVSSLKETDTKTFILSHSLKLDLDPYSKSYKPEILKVHYDTIHNPNHCFHIRLEWLLTTSKLIDDTINGWSRMCERYGLKLVETPWNELCDTPKLNPFHSYVDIKLALNPWDPSNEEIYNEEILKHSKFYYHIFLLEYSDFLMDNRASMFFQDEANNKPKFDIKYSWGKPRFKYAQYIHRTGAYIAEIRDTGDLFLAPNNTHIARVNVGNVSLGNYSGNPSFVLDSQNIMLEFRRTCFNASKLREIFDKANELWGAHYRTGARAGDSSPTTGDLNI